MRSGCCAATFSTSMPSVLLRTVGALASPSSSSAHGKIAPGCLPYHSVVATGTTPSASSASCSRSPTTTTRFGAVSIFVVPYLWSIETGNAASSDRAPESLPAVSCSSDPHAASAVATSSTKRSEIERIRAP